MLYKFSHSLYHTKKIGYYYIQNQQSITKNFLKDRERTIKNCFIYLKFIFEYTKNNQYEKNMASCIYHNVILEISNTILFDIENPLILLKKGTLNSGKYILRKIVKDYLMNLRLQ